MISRKDILFLLLMLFALPGLAQSPPGSPGPPGIDVDPRTGEGDPPDVCNGDLDGDGNIDWNDRWVLWDHILYGPYNPEGDYTRNGALDWDDLTVWNALGLPWEQWTIGTLHHVCFETSGADCCVVQSPVITAQTYADIQATAGQVVVPDIGTLQFDPAEVQPGDEVSVYWSAETVNVEGYSLGGDPIEVEVPDGVTQFDFLPDQGDTVVALIGGGSSLTDGDYHPYSFFPGGANILPGSWHRMREGFRTYVLIPLIKGQVCEYDSGQHWWWPEGKVKTYWFTNRSCASEQETVDGFTVLALNALADLVLVQGYDDPGPVDVHYQRGPDAPDFASSSDGKIYVNQAWLEQQSAEEQKCVISHEMKHVVDFGMNGWNIRNAWFESSAVYEETRLCDFSEGPALRYPWTPEVVKRGLNRFYGLELYTGLSWFFQDTFTGQQMSECMRAQAPAILSRDYINAAKACLNYDNEALTRAYAAAAYRYISDNVAGWPDLYLPTPATTSLDEPITVGAFREFTVATTAACLTASVPVDHNPDLILSVYMAGEPNLGYHRELLLATDNKIRLRTPGQSDDLLHAGTYHIGVTSIIGIPPFKQDQEVALSVEYGPGPCEPDEPDTSDLFQHGEKWYIRPASCEAAGQQENDIGFAQRFPQTGGTRGETCTCGPNFTRPGGRKCYELTFTLSTAQDWPGCVVGKDSGGAISQDWPGQPGGWPGNPESFSNPLAGACSLSTEARGAMAGSNYEVKLKHCPGQCTTIYPECTECTMTVP